MLRSRDAKYAGKKIFDGSAFYAHASFTKWRTGAKVFIVRTSREVFLETTPDCVQVNTGKPSTTAGLVIKIIEHFGKFINCDNTMEIFLVIITHSKRYFIS